MQDIPFISETDSLEKGITLMEQAVKQYKDGKYELANHSRKAANKFLDEIESQLSTEEGAEAAMYGESRNFGLIYRVIEENANRLYETADGRKKIASILNFIKGNDILLHEFRVYDALTNPVGVEDPELYVNEAVSVIKRQDRKIIIEENSKLIKFVKTVGINENVDIDSESMALYEAVEYILLNAPQISNLKEYTSIKKMVCESVAKHNRTIEKNKDMDSIRDNTVHSITEKLNHELNDDEKALLESIGRSKENAEKAFADIKENLVSELKAKINEAEESDKEGWQKILETVVSKTFNMNTLLSDIADMATLHETIQ